MRIKAKVPARPVSAATQRWMDAIRPRQRARYIRWGESYAGELEDEARRRGREDEKRAAERKSRPEAASG